MASSAPRGLRSDHVVTVGIALFSMLFGAGNLIIPPLLALQAGTATPLAMIGFLIAAIGLPVMGFIAVALAGTARELASRVHPKFGEFFVAAVYLAIGPCLAIPRTSSTAFEMLVPLLPEGVSLGVARLVFAIGFFVVAFVLTLRPGVITRVLGRITGPALIALIVLVVGAAVISPLGPAAAPQAPYDAGAAVQGFLTGYQTMDLLASLAFGIIIAETIHELGVTDDKRVAFEISRSGVIAGVLMAIIYCGLGLAGMHLGTVMPDATNGAAILARSASMHFGLAGTVVVFAIFFLACMNVCIGLISCCSRYFCETYVVEGGAEASEEANAEFRNIVWPLYEQPAREKLWSGGFVCPAENYMTLVDFGQVKVTGGKQGSKSNSTKLYTIPGEPCRAPAAGVVVLTKYLALTGNTVVIDHGCGLRSYLYGLDALSVSAGQRVERGQAVGALGEEMTMDFKLGSKSVNPWPLFQTSGGLFWKENG